jgi:hypothetical protein
MDFTLTIETSNDAFQPDPEAEIARILRETARRVVNGNYAGRLIDVNGNRVGEFRLDP